VEAADYVIWRKFAAATPGPAILGDYDSSGTVNEADRTLWRTSFGSSADVRADGNRNAIVDAADYVIWRKVFDTAGGAAPELFASHTVASATLHAPAIAFGTDSRAEGTKTQLRTASETQNTAKFSRSVVGYSSGLEVDSILESSPALAHSARDIAWKRNLDRAALRDLARSNREWSVPRRDLLAMILADDPEWSMEAADSLLEGRIPARNGSELADEIFAEFDATSRPAIHLIKRTPNK
jgi:hypothetical protein